MAEHIVIVTVVHGRHAHLREQRRILRDVSPGTPHIVVAMDDHAIDDVVAGQSSVTVIHVERDPRGLPLARARNIGVRAALRSGADLVVLLDVDCVPGPRLVSSYEIAAERVPQALLCGPVTYLDEGVRVPDDARRLDDLTDPHPARPAPAPDTIQRDGSHELFWSLSFAVKASTWDLLGGFAEEYVGYGAEDTDLGRVARERGVELVWVGGAHAYHQHHPVSRPPVEHLVDIVRNASIYWRRWHEWPMSGWLDEFERQGRIIRRPGEIVLVATADGHETRA